MLTLKEHACATQTAATVETNHELKHQDVHTFNLSHAESKVQCDTAQHVSPWD